MQLHIPGSVTIAAESEFPHRADYSTNRNFVCSLEIRPWPIPLSVSLSLFRLCRCALNSGLFWRARNCRRKPAQRNPLPFTAKFRAVLVPVAHFDETSNLFAPARRAIGKRARDSSRKVAAKVRREKISHGTRHELSRRED